MWRRCPRRGGTRDDAVTAPGGMAPAVDFAAATSLARELDFARPQPRHFGAPPARSRPFRSGSFEGEVARGASCNCAEITLIPHCNGTHTESVGHLTLQQEPLHHFAPLAPMPALLLTVPPREARPPGETSLPVPEPGDLLITLAALREAWRKFPACRPRALLLRTGADIDVANPPYLSRELAAEIVAQGIEHLVIDLPSVDRAADAGHLTAHRTFFGLPAGSTDLGAATRAHCTITELATFPVHLGDGPCALQLQLPAWNSDAVPSRPLYLPLAPA